MKHPVYCANKIHIYGMRLILMNSFPFQGFYGDALAPNKGNCKPCLCNSLGTLELESGEMNCDQLNGQCKCKPHVIGTNCDECEPGYYDINSGQVRTDFKTLPLSMSTSNSSYLTYNFETKRRVAMLATVTQSVRSITLAISTPDSATVDPE